MVYSGFASFFQNLGNILTAMNKGNALVYMLIAMFFVTSAAFFVVMAIKMELKDIKPKKKQEKKPS